MTIDQWLDTRQPAPPAPLMEGVKSALASALGNDSSETASICIVTAERMLRDLVTSGVTDRSIAASLLTIDALTTYALESAAETVQGLTAFSDDAIGRLAGTRSPNDEPPKTA